MQPVELLKLLADETRLATVLLVQRYGELCVCELTEALDLSQPKVSRHLAQLRTAELLTGEKRGQWVYYRVSPSLDAAANAVLASLASAYGSYIQLAVERLGDCAPKAKAPGCCQPRESANF